MEDLASERKAAARQLRYQERPPEAQTSGSHASVLMISKRILVTQSLKLGPLPYDYDAVLIWGLGLPKPLCQ